MASVPSPVRAERASMSVVPLCAFEDIAAILQKTSQVFRAAWLLPVSCRERDDRPICFILKRLRAPSCDFLDSNAAIVGEAKAASGKSAQVLQSMERG
jgi:hypothetical protein